MLRSDERIDEFQRREKGEGVMLLAGWRDDNHLAPPGLQPASHILLNSRFAEHGIAWPTLAEASP
ncbi:MAG: hypothetical protein J0G36_16535 [Afipia sp.]|nr:hypothetical protein [Afipia sp.]